MKKLLVTGASGFLGWNVCQVAQQDWLVYGTYHSRTVKIPGSRLTHLNLTDLQAVQQLFHTLCPDAVIHLAAQSSPNVCQLHPTESYDINVTAACNLAGLCADAGIPFVFTSTDLVFDGLNPPYREGDPICPVNRYGEQKAAAEQGILDRYPTSAVCRMPLMFGFSPHAPSFIQGFIQTLRSRQQLNLFIDEFRSPVSGTTAAQGLLMAIDNVQGLIHLGGKERISRYDFGCLMVEVLDLPSETLKACRQADVKMAAPRPPDLGLDSSRAFALGYSPRALREELAALKGKV